MRSSRNNILAGSLVLAAVFTAVVVVVYLGGAADRFGKRAYIVAFSLDEGVTGLQPGSGVTVGGHDVGVVDAIRFVPNLENPTGLEVTIRIDRKLRLRAGANAQLVTPLLGGTSTINFISTGTGAEIDLDQVVLDGQLAPPGALAQAGYGPEQAGQLRRILRRADEITSKATTSMDDVNASVADVRAIAADVRERATGWFDRVDSITSNVDETTAMAPDIAASVDERLEQFRELVETAQGTLAENRDDVRATIERARAIGEKGDSFMDRLNGELVDQVAGMFEDGRAAITSARETLEKADTTFSEQLPQIRHAIANFRLASDQLTATLSEVRRSPWRLLYRPDKRELEFELLYDSARAYASAVSDLRAASEAVQAGGAGGDSGDADETRRQRLLDLVSELDGAFSRYQTVEQQFLDLVSQHARRGKP